MSTTNKSKKRTERSSKKTYVVKELAKKYRVTEATIYLSLRGELDTELAETIKKDYHRIEQELPGVIEGPRKGSRKNSNNSKLFIQQ